MNRNDRLLARWLWVALLAPCAMAQTPEADRQREYQRQQDEQRQEQQRRAQEEMQRQQKAAEESSKRQQQLHDETTKNIEDYSKRRSQAAPAGPNGTDMRADRSKSLATPPLPAARNVLLGNWRVESGGQGGGVTGLGQGQGAGRNAMARELLTTFSNPCVLMFGNGVTFAPSTYSIQALDGSVFRGSVDYRSPQKQVILAITQETWKTLPFEIEGPNRIVWGRFGCALVRVGAPAANAAANATTAPGNARTAPVSARDGSAVANAPDGSAAVVDGAAFRCADGSLLHVSFCQGDAAQATCKLTELHQPGLQMGKLVPRSHIAARVKSCEAGGIRYGADDKPVFVR